MLYVVSEITVIRKATLRFPQHINLVVQNTRRHALELEKVNRLPKLKAWTQTLFRSETTRI